MSARIRLVMLRHYKNLFAGDQIAVEKSAADRMLAMGVARLEAQEANKAAIAEVLMPPGPRRAERLERLDVQGERNC
jgi:hypothetical protein